MQLRRLVAKAKAGELPSFDDANFSLARGPTYGPVPEITGKAAGKG
jgi:hypothetical protein